MSTDPQNADYGVEDSSRKRVDMCWCGNSPTPDIRCAVHRSKEWLQPQPNDGGQA